MPTLSHTTDNRRTQVLRKLAEAIATATITGFWVYVIAYWALTGKLV